MKEDEKLHTKRLVENSNFLRDQMTYNPLKQGKIKQAAVSKTVVRGAMNEEEIRINKSILKEISQKKKDYRSPQPNYEV